MTDAEKGVLKEWKKGADNFPITNQNKFEKAIESCH
jgi:hypothetical protein